MCVLYQLVSGHMGLAQNGRVPKQPTGSSKTTRQSESKQSLVGRFDNVEFKRPTLRLKWPRQAVLAVILSVHYASFLDRHATPLPFKEWKM